ncbi:MAG: glycosyltransferase family 8 protein [Gloeotrichia echinulata IR180]|jgi:lipopolysaccharide biosynthesis glycosyltransferase|nr:glycosyltransferase family 8 protein [Gloeotrichia echinulata DEX184]
MSISVVCTIDDKYAQHCAVMLTSLFKNNPTQVFEVYIISDSIKSKEFQKLEIFLNPNIHKFYFIKIDKDSFQEAPISHHISIAAYFRLLITEVLPIELEKVLYIDSDIIFRRKIDDLWKIDIGNFTHAATIAIGMDDYPKKIGLPENSLYFNSGLMLINLEYWRGLKIFERGCELIRQQREKLQWWDQDVLNILLHNSWLPIDLTWNSQVFMDDEEVPISSLYQEKYTKFNYLKAKVDPAIVHFIGGGSAKPWYYACKHPFKHEYEKYLHATPWKNTIPIGQPSLISRIRFRLGIGSKLRQIWQVLTNKFI